jgi:formyl-CoA transferase
MLLNGASTSMMLADLGADVIKVESPSLGDYIRAPDTAHLHRQANRAKRSITVDLRAPEGHEILVRLVRRTDVFVTNALESRSARLGLDYPRLREIKADLIYCRNTGYGATGPYSDIPTHGQMMDALAGALPVERGPEGLVEPSSRYVRRTGSLASAGEGTSAGAIYAAFHIAAALAKRNNDGTGCYIDVSSAAAVLCSAWVAASALMNVPERRDWWQSDRNTRPIARYQSYETADGLFVLFCPEERKFWHLFCDLVHRPDLKSRERGLDLRQEIQGIIGTRPREQWLALAIAHNLPIGPINNSMADVQDDPQMQARQIFVADGAGATSFVHVGQPAWVDGEPASIRTDAPQLGEDTQEILTELGYSPLEIDGLRERNITSAARSSTDHISRALFGGNS